MAKILKFDIEAREKLLKGINILTEAVAATLGPKGRNVAIDKKYGPPTVVHDGVTVAKEIELEDPFENMGAQLLKEAASKTNDVAGDGTTTSTILAHAVVTEALKLVAAGHNPMKLKQELDEACRKVLDVLKASVKQIKHIDEIEQVATVSAGNVGLGKLIAEAMKKVGPEGVVTVEESKSVNTTLEHREGMDFDKGYASPYFVTDSDRMEANLENPYILIADKKIASMQDLMPFLEKFIQVSKTLVIIAEDYEGDVLTTLVLNKLRGTFNVLALSAPGFGDRRKSMLADIAVLTGGTVISEDTGRKLDSVEVSDLGQAGRVTSTKDSTVIVGGKGKKKDIDARVAQIKKEMAQSDSEYDKEKLQERLGKLTVGVAVINVGAATEVEMKEKKERVIDAVAATRAAYAEGIVIGGEMALYKAREVLVKRGKLEEDDDGLIVAERDFTKPGYTILFMALQAPLRRLLQNTYGDDDIVLKIMADLSVEMIKALVKATDSKGMVKHEEVQFNLGHDVNSGKKVDMYKAGIIDPLKVTRSALENAVSVATMILTTNVLITDAPVKESPSMPGGGMQGMGDY